jgi:hypothetical protein
MQSLSVILLNVVAISYITIHYQHHFLFRPTLVYGEEKGLKGKENYPNIYLQKLNETRKNVSLSVDITDSTKLGLLK